jgi:polyisoprenoid-binding protein YceI
MLKPGLIAALLAPLATMLPPISGAARAEPQTYQIETGHSGLAFSYNHQGFSDVFGLLGGVSGTIVFDRESPEKSSVEARLPLASLSTANTARDHDLLSESYLHAEKYPEVHFRSTSITLLSADHALIEGELSLNGITRPVVLDTTLNKDGTSAKGVDTIGLSASTILLRSDFNAGRGAPGNSDVVGVQLSIEASRAEASRAETH